MANEKKIMFSILKELQSKSQIPSHFDYDLEHKDFVGIVKLLDDEKLIKNEKSSFRRTERGVSKFLSHSELTYKGIEFIESNSGFAKTYKTLKEFREWLPL